MRVARCASYDLVCVYVSAAVHCLGVAGDRPGADVPGSAASVSVR